MEASGCGEASGAVPRCSITSWSRGLPPIKEKLCKEDPSGIYSKVGRLRRAGPTKDSLMASTQWDLAGQWLIKKESIMSRIALSGARVPRPEALGAPFCLKRVFCTISSLLGAICERGIYLKIHIL